jgi:hypothetical protein
MAPGMLSAAAQRDTLCDWQCALARQYDARRCISLEQRFTPDSLWHNTRDNRALEPTRPFWPLRRAAQRWTLGLRGIAMDLEDGLQLERPSVFVPWSVTRQDLWELCPMSRMGRQGLKEVTADYYVLSDVVSLGGLTHELGFHFGVRDELVKFEIFRRTYTDLGTSYAEFQQHLERALDKPTHREPGAEGYDRCLWQGVGFEVLHELVDRFGPEEHVWITRVPKRHMWPWRGLTTA